MKGHRWGTWRYLRVAKLWVRHCTVGQGHCTAIQTRKTKP